MQVSFPHSIPFRPPLHSFIGHLCEVAFLRFRVWVKCAYHTAANSIHMAVRGFMVRWLSGCVDVWVGEGGEGGEGLGWVR